MKSAICLFVIACVLGKALCALLLANGDSQLNISAMDSYIIPLSVYNLTTDGFATLFLAAKLENTKFEDVGKIKVNDAKLNVDNLVVDVDVFHPKLTIQTEFEVTGKLFELPVYTKGSFKGKFIDVNSHYKIQLEISERNGSRFFTIKDLMVNLAIGDGSMSISAKDPEQQRLADLLQNLFNENAKEYLKELSPAFSYHGEVYYQPIVEKLIFFIQPDEILPK
ncbi:hypothetical protein ILUMI_04933 [Ignelater luminosus]|uniref:Uncharacterized protein n=1 Tax=Ignelater luminosus TaxID=2038154 RepID=A0A8K0DDB2_IGNLU|nr:hypothetical protein ILUMI_04933 [Ignelater luminosus]